MRRFLIKTGEMSVLRQYLLTIPDFTDVKIISEDLHLVTIRHHSNAKSLHATSDNNRPDDALRVMPIYNMMIKCATKRVNFEESISSPKFDNIETFDSTYEAIKLYRYYNNLKNCVIATKCMYRGIDDIIPFVDTEYSIQDMVKLPMLRDKYSALCAACANDISFTKRLYLMILRDITGFHIDRITKRIA